MPSLTKRTFSGRTYYYLRETARVKGKPKVVRTTYLGRAEDIEAALRGALVPTTVKSLAFGDVAAALAVLRRLGLREVIDRVASKREQGPRPSPSFRTAGLADRGAALRPETHPGPVPLRRV